MQPQRQEPGCPPAPPNITTRQAVSACIWALLAFLLFISTGPIFFIIISSSSLPSIFPSPLFPPLHFHWILYRPCCYNTYPSWPNSRFLLLVAYLHSPSLKKSCLRADYSPFTTFPLFFFTFFNHLVDQLAWTSDHLLFSSTNTQLLNKTTVFQLIFFHSFHWQTHEYHSFYYKKFQEE